MNNREIVRLLYPYHNVKTFLYLESSLAIPADRLLVLDTYAFNVDELVANAQHDVKNIYRNPHITEVHENNRFSDEAIAQLRLHPELAQFARQLDETLATQANGISTATIDAVLTLVKAFDRDGLRGSTMARYNFNLYFETLSEDEKQKLNRYLIEVKSLAGGNQSYIFENAFIGGDPLNQCFQIARIFMWQFVVDFRPEEMANIPRELIRLMAAPNIFLQIQPKIQYFGQPTPPALPLNRPAPRAAVSAVVHVFNNGTTQRLNQDQLTPDQLNLLRRLDFELLATMFLARSAQPDADPSANFTTMPLGPDLTVRVEFTSRRNPRP